MLGGWSPVVAQEYHMPATPTKGVWVEATYADLEGFDQSFPSTVWFVSGRLPLTSNGRMVADLPLAYSRMRLGAGPRETSTVLGNPFVGLEYVRSAFVLGTGVRLPVNSIGDDTFADAVAFLSDFQRGEAFLDDVVPVTATATYVQDLPVGVSLRAQAGVVGLFQTGNEDGEDEGTEALVDYGLLGTVPMGQARLGLGFYGRWAATEDTGSFQDNSVHHLAVSGDYRWGSVRPGVAVRIPIDDAYGEILNATVGVYVQVALR
jgi:hypothetical protein